MDELSMLLGLGQMGMSGMQNASNTALGSVPMFLSIADRFRARMDPDMRRYGQILRGRYNDASAMNPYGDPYSGWGGMFGYRDDGSAIGAGEAYARGINQMMGQNPMVPTIQNYQTLAGMQRPQVSDASAGMANLMGHDSSVGGYTSPMFDPATINARKATNTDFGGAPASTARDNTIRENKPLDPYLSAGTAGGDRGSFTPRSGGGGTGPGNGWLMPIGGRMLSGFMNSHGGAGQLMSDLRGPGSMIDNIGDFVRGGSQHGIPQQGGRPLRKSYAVGTPFVPQTGKVTVHQGEMITPAHMNPNARLATGGIKPAPGVTPGVPMMATGGNMNNTGRIAGPNRGGVSQGMSGGGTSTPTTPGTQPHSLMQDLINNPVALTPEIQNQMINQGTDWLQNQYGGIQRNAYANSAANGAPVNNAALNSNMVGQIGDLRRNVATDAARTNYQNLANSAGLQMQGELGLGNLQLQQQQFQQGLYNQDYSNMARIIDSLYGTSQNGMNQQGNWWQQLTGLTNQGAHFADPFLQSAIQNAMWSIQPSQIAQAPQVAGSNPASVGLDALQGWQSLWGN